jgi:hypothetical protein
MVKILDFERTDPTVRFLKYLEAWRNRGSLLPHDKIMKVLQDTIKEQGEYIDRLGGVEKMPSIVLKGRCSDSNKYKDSWKNVAHFPAYFDRSSHSIVLCVGLIRHETKLKENFVREFYGATFPAVSGLSPDENLARACYRGCLESMRVYTSDNKQLDAMARTCTKYMFKVAFGDLAPPYQPVAHEERRLPELHS